MTRTNFCYVISNGFAARMLLQTRLLERLAEKGKNVAVIVPDAEDRKFQLLNEDPNIEVHQADLRLTIFDDDYGFKRRYFLEDIQSNPVFVEKHKHSLYWSKSKHPWKRIRPIYYYLIYLLIKIFPGIRKRFKRNEKRHLDSKRADHLMKKIAPEVVIGTYPINYLEAKILYAAEKAGVKKVIHLLSWDNITSKGIFPVKADFYVAWGSIMAEEIKSYYQVRDDQFAICGVPHFDHHINRKKDTIIFEKYGIDPKRPYVFFGMSSPRFAPYEIEIIEEMSKWDIQMIVRPHPQNVTGSMADKSWLGRLEKLKRPGLGLSLPQLEASRIRWSMMDNDMDELTDIIHFSSVVLNSGSTISIDALILGKPVIITSFDAHRKLGYWKSARRLKDYVHLRKFISKGGAEVAYDFDGLRSHISTYISNPDHGFTKRKKVGEEYCYKLDGRSTDRVIDAMLDHA